MTATIYRLVLSQQARTARVLALGLFGVVGIVVGLAIGLGDTPDRLQAGTELINAFGLTIYAPVVCLVFASAALGEPVEDGTLLYLWLRPVARWRIVAGAWLAALTAALPLVVGVLSVAALATGGGLALVKGTILATVVATLAYTAIFCLLGLLVRRPLVWGLAYILLWEGFVALAGRNAARLAVRAYTRTILSQATGVELRLATLSLPVSYAVPLLVGAGALALATWRLRHVEVA